MREQDKLVPKRRFERFTDEWVQHKLRELCEKFQSGKGIKSENVFEEGKYPVYGGNGFRGYTHTYNHNGLYALIGRQGALCGNMNISQGKAYFTEHAISVKGNKHSHTRFLYYILGKMNLGQYSGQSAQPGLAVNKLIELTTFIPTYKEQQKIGQFFKHLDEMITLEQRKIDKTKALKSAYLAEMFPAEGERVPKRRFAGFMEEWKKYKFENVADMFNNLRIPVTASVRIPGDTPYYGANGIQDYVKGNTHDGEFVLVAEDGANDLSNYPVQYVNGKVWVNNHAHVITGKNNIIDNLFLVSRMKSMDISKWLVGGGRAKLNAEVLKNIQIEIPNFEEQNKIGLLFKQLDNIIVTHQCKLDKLKATKQAYLHEMFV